MYTPYMPSNALQSSNSGLMGKTIFFLIIMIGLILTTLYLTKKKSKTSSVVPNIDNTISVTPATLQPMTTAPIITTAPVTLQPMTTAPIITTAPVTLQPMTTAPIITIAPVTQPPFTNIIGSKASINAPSGIKDLRFHLKPSPTQTVVSFAEIQVFDTNNVNIAKTGTATMSKYIDVASADKAIDGNTDGDYSNKSVMHSEVDPNAYWELAFPSAVRCSKIVIWNRTDCCMIRLADVVMTITFGDNSTQTINLTGDAQQIITIINI